MAPQDFRDHALYLRLMPAVEALGGGMNVWPLSVRRFGAAGEKADGR